MASQVEILREAYAVLQRISAEIRKGDQSNIADLESRFQSLWKQFMAS